jgi:hypothetical protein
MNAEAATLTLDEVWEQLQPGCDVFEAAEWLNIRIRTKKVRLLGDGVVIAPGAFPNMLIVKPLIAADGRASLKIEVLQALDRVISEWRIERATFERERAVTKDRGGRPRVYDHAEVLAAALVYVGVYGCPDTLEGEGGLAEQVELELGKRGPQRTTLCEILRPPFRRIKQRRGTE